MCTKQSTIQSILLLLSKDLSHCLSTITLLTISLCNSIFDLKHLDPIRTITYYPLYFESEEIIKYIRIIIGTTVNF